METDWKETSRPYRILAGALEIRRRQGNTERDHAILALAEQTAKELESDPSLSDYGRFRVEGYRMARAKVPA